MTAVIDELVERLRRQEHRGRYAPGGGSIDHAGKSSSWGGEKIMELVNPDGPEAASLLLAMKEALASVRHYVENVAAGDGTAAQMVIAQADLEHIDATLNQGGGSDKSA